MEPDIADAPACPLLGLLGDRRSHFTFPQADHRCHTTHRPQRIDVAQQAELCLSATFPTCTRYRVWGPERGDARRVPAASAVGEGSLGSSG